MENKETLTQAEKECLQFQYYSLNQRYHNKTVITSMVLVNLIKMGVDIQTDLARDFLDELFESDGSQHDFIRANTYHINKP